MDYMQLAFSFIAITVLAVIARLLFPVRDRLTEERVSRNFARCYPDLATAAPLIADDGAAALVPLATTRQELGLVTQLGDRVVCRLLAPADVAGVELSADRLHIRFHDFTYPDVTFLASGDAQEKANNLLKDLNIEVARDAA